MADEAVESSEKATHRLTYLGPGNDVRDPVRQRVHRVGKPVDVSQADAERLITATPGESWTLEDLSETGDEETDAR